MAVITPFTGVRIVNTTSERINQLYKDKVTTIGKKDYPNAFIVFKAEGSQSALTRVNIDGVTASLINEKQTAGKIKPRNKEQQFALDILLDINVSVITLTGIAGSGKTLMAIATAMELVDQEEYDKIILTRPMDAMGQMKDLGAMPGNIDEKFGVYLHNFIDNFDVIVKKENKKNNQNYLSIAEQYNMSFIPLQVMRGASFSNAIILADEIQTLTPKQLLGLGTRVGENSKLILMGDLSQRDSNIKQAATGLYQFVNNEGVKNSPLVGHLELLKCERSATSQLFANTFKDIE